MLYVDGIAICEKPQKSIWPVFAELLDLHPNIRDTKNNKIISGVWYGGHPTSDVLFGCLCDELKSIETTGINVVIGPNLINYKVHLYGVLCDTPAKAIVMNMTQFNGYDSCPYCYIHGMLNSRINCKDLYKSIKNIQLITDST
jgi:hypothetical protein